MCSGLAWKTPWACPEYVFFFFSWQLIHYKVLMNFKDIMKEERVLKECSRLLFALEALGRDFLCRGAGWKASI